MLRDLSVHCAVPLSVCGSVTGYGFKEPVIWKMIGRCRIYELFGDFVHSLSESRTAADCAYSAVAHLGVPSCHILKKQSSAEQIEMGHFLHIVKQPSEIDFRAAVVSPDYIENIPVVYPDIICIGFESFELIFQQFFIPFPQDAFIEMKFSEKTVFRRFLAAHMKSETEIPAVEILCFFQRHGK